jgi:hypothetical protein
MSPSVAQVAGSSVIAVRSNGATALSLTQAIGAVPWSQQQIDGRGSVNGPLTVTQLSVTTLPIPSPPKV